MAPDPVIDRLADLEAIYRAQRHHFQGYFVRRGARPDSAAELVQETFARAVRNISGFKGESTLSTWVYRIAQAVVADHFRSLGRSPQEHAFSLDDLMDSDANLPSQLNGSSGCSLPTGLATRRALVAFARQHPERAEVLHLVALHGWSNDELAEWLGRSSHAAAQYLSQCRLLLHTCLQEHLPENEP